LSSSGKTPALGPDESADNGTTAQERTAAEENHLQEKAAAGSGQPPLGVPPNHADVKENTENEENEDGAGTDTVTLAPFDIETSVSSRDLPFEKLKSSAWVARALVMTFAASILVWFFVAALVIGVSSSPVQARQFADALVPFLREYSSFATAVFSPLLAFVLGFYFSEKNNQ
jgi:hypothetical protein